MPENKYVKVKRIYADGTMDTKSLGLMTMFEAEIEAARKSAVVEAKAATKRINSTSIISIKLTNPPQSLDILL